MGRGGFGDNWDSYLNYALDLAMKNDAQTWHTAHIHAHAGCPNSRLAAPSCTHAYSYASECTPQLRNEQARLLALREDNKGAEAALRKAKKRAQQDVEAVIGEYDQDLGSKEEEYQEVRGAGFCVPG